jgi:DNA-binding GntR family transcriptional regulator
MVVTSNIDSLSLEVYKRIKDDLMSAKYPPGSVLFEVKISRELGVSRTPVRHAMYLIEKEGLVQRIPKYGVVVVEHTLRDVLDTLELKEALYGAAARLAALGRTTGDIPRLEEFQSALKSAPRGEAISFMNRLLGTTVGISGNARFTKILAELPQEMPPKSQLDPGVAGSAEETMKDANELCAAVIAGDAETAESVAKEHFRRQGREALASLNARYLD